MWPWHSPEEAMPWVGLYAAVASLVCTFAMAADAFQGFRQRKLWFPCRFFTLNAASITLIAIAMKLPVDLTTDSDRSSYELQNAKIISIMFLLTMLANSLPSLGLMDDKELLLNIIALGILIITITVNVYIQLSTDVFLIIVLIPSFIFPLLWPFSVALTVPASRRILEHQHKQLHRLTSNGQERKLSSIELIQYLKKYWIMAESGNPQFTIACSPICSASGVIVSLFVSYSVYNLVTTFCFKSYCLNGVSDYKWSIYVITATQSIGVVIGSIAPTFRCLTAFSLFNFSKKWCLNHINVFRVEKHCTQRLRYWKRCHVRSHIPGRHCKIVFHNVKNIILNICIAFQIMVVVICKIGNLIPSSLLILFSCCCYMCNSLMKKLKHETNVSRNTVRSEIEEYTSYVIQIEEEVKLSKRIIRNTLNSITRLLRESEKKEPKNLVKLLEKSTGFDRVGQFDDDQVPPLHAEQTLNCWSLVIVTLTAIAIALPNISNGHVKGLLASVREGLQYVKHIEETLNANSDLVMTRKAARRVWTEVEVYCKWLRIDLQNKARKGKTSGEILQWLGDEAVKIVIQFKTRKNRSLEQSLHKPIAASSMYRISQTLVLHCREQENWPNDEELFEWISTMIADILCACFTNLPRVITMKCYDNAIGKREESIRTAAQILGKTKKILNTLQDRQLPGLDLDSQAYIDDWYALLKGHKPASLSRIQAASSSSNELLIVTIV